MPKPISERGFEVSKGNANRCRIMYKINEEGDEIVYIFKYGSNPSLESSVAIYLEDGQINRYTSSTPQFNNYQHTEGEEWETDSEQALALYHEVKKILNVEEELKNYKPRFSNECEITPFNVLGIDSEKDLEGLIG